MVDAQTLGEALERLMRVDPIGSAGGCAIRRYRGGAERLRGHFRIADMAPEIGGHEGMYPLVLK